MKKYVSCIKITNKSPKKFPLTQASIAILHKKIKKNKKKHKQKWDKFADILQMLCSIKWKENYNDNPLESVCVSAK